MFDTTASTAKEKEVKAKQRAFFWRAFGLFVLFSFAIAPLEYHLDWYYHFARHKYTLLDSSLVEPLAGGVLYYFEIIVSFEAILFLAAYPEVLEYGWMMKFVRIALWACVVPFVFDFLAAGIYPRPGEDMQEIPIKSLELQCVTALVALLLSVITHTVSLRFESRRQHL